MAEFKIEDIVELLDHPNSSIVEQVLDVVLSSEACMTDSGVIDRLIKLLSNAALVKRSIAVLTHIAAEHSNAISTVQAKTIFLKTFPLCFMPSQAPNTNGVLALVTNLTLSESNSTEFLSLTQLCEPLESSVVGPDGKKRSVPSLLDQAITRFVEYNPQIESVTEFAPPGMVGVLVAGTEGAKEWSAAATKYFDSVDRWQHIGSVLCNLCRLAEGRAVLLKRSSNYMPRLVQQIRSLNPARRRGSVSTLRSCLFDTAVHWWLVEEVRVLRYLLYPIVVGTPIKNKERLGMDTLLWMRADMLRGAVAVLKGKSDSTPAADTTEGSSSQQPTTTDLVQAGASSSAAPSAAGGTDHVDVPDVMSICKEDAALLAPPECEMDIAAHILECVLLLCQRRVIRECLRKQQVYVICRNFDVESGVDRVSEVMFEVVNFLMRDESGDEEAQLENGGTAGDVSLSELKLLDSGSATAGSK